MGCRLFVPIMPRITKSYVDTITADGSAGHKFTIDLPMMLSERYGKLVRQGQLFKIESVAVRVFNPDTLVQDRLITASGRILWISPTKNRKDAWKSAFRAVQNLRKTHGLKSPNYDFRVGLNDAYPRVVQQAWIRDEDEVLNLTSDSTDQNGIFAVHNSQLGEMVNPADELMNGFGTPYDLVGVNSWQDLDFKEGISDSGFFIQGYASQILESEPFSVSHAGSFDNAGEDDFVGVTNAEYRPIDAFAMCGLLGVVIDTMVPDDTELQSQDYGIEVTVNVKSWTPIISKRKSKKKSTKSKGKK